jgi:hypothetical protein
MAGIFRSADSGFEIILSQDKQHLFVDVDFKRPEFNSPLGNHPLGFRM